MSEVSKKKIYRVLDANLNRAKEGLRVCEDVCRFINDDPLTTKKFKTLRHRLTDIFLRFPSKELLSSREIESDVGRPSTQSELKRTKVDDIFIANLQRVKESIRVLEEFAKLINKPGAEQLKKLRYDIYAIEKRVAGQR